MPNLSEASMNSQQPENSTNLLLAVTLSLAVLVIWQILFPPPKPQRPPATQAQTGEGVVPGGQGVVPGIGAPPGAPAASAAPTPRLPIEAKALKGSIGLKGGRIDDLTLVGYHEKADKSSPLVALFRPADSALPYFSENGWVAPAGSSVAVPGRDTIWSAPADAKLATNQPVTLTWDNGGGLTFKRTIALDDKFMFTIKDEVVNASAGDVVLYPYARIYRYGTPKIEGFFIQHEGAIGWIGETQRLKEFTYQALQDETTGKSFAGVKGGWLGFTDKYWAAAIIPDQAMTYTANMSVRNRATATEQWAYQTDWLGEAVTVPAGAEKAVTSRLFAGAKEVGPIEAYEQTGGIMEFDYLVDWGWFWFITKPLYHLLDWLYKQLGNFGLAILGVTVIVKLVFYPLANKAYESMAKMKKLQPQMEQLRERFKDDKARQQQELMQLYQKEKINPLAGCLPILLQIPVFFALYKVLFVSIDMRHAPFYGWITDLSAPDPTSLFNLFGLLPFAVPEMLHVGLWPLIMGVTMWLQMQLNPPQPDPTQQMIFNWMPVLFTFLLATFPAGLVIYWAWNNVLSLAQQWYIMKRLGTEVPIFDNIKKTLASVTGIIPKKKG
ncbi:MAG: membrane protein insertase YidC [Hyphomicrobiaceae bacterium]|nr:membrane protein insertase YidC [Hyphomicrobiaceae bacterium]